MFTRTEFQSPVTAAAIDADYSEAQLVMALREAGICSGDVVFVQAALDALGKGRGIVSADLRSTVVLRALRRAVGSAGTVVVPTYTFSFCRHEPFDTELTPTEGGPWNPSADFLEYVRQSPQAVRSCDPIHSVVAIGPMAARLLADLPRTCFGPDSVQHRLRREGAKLCALGLGLHESTMIHHAEAMMGVPFRFKKLFTGEITSGGVTRRQGWVYDVRILAPNAELDASRIVTAAIDQKLIQTVPVGRGTVQVIDAGAFYDELCDALRRDPWATVKGPPADPVALESRRVSAHVPRVTLPPASSMETIVRTLHPVARDIVSDGYDAALAALGTQLPMRIHEYRTGTECFTWIVPEKWTCQEAWLETLDGRRLFSYTDHPLHVVSYSLPFEGVVSRDELLQHLHVHERLPDAVPFVFKYYERDWGLCCSRTMRDTLTDASYRVVIRSSFSYGTLKVGEITAPGKTDETVVLCAHLCHPGMAVDDLSGVAVGIGVMRELLSGAERRRYTYRLLIVPETIGSLAYLSANEPAIPYMKGGLFLEMLGLDRPHVLQRSYAGNTEVDECFVRALQRCDASGWTTPFRSIVGNDERQFNAPGIRVPMLSLLRVLRPGAPDYPYREYHSSFDTPELISSPRLEESRNLVLEMIAALEANRLPVNRFKGEVCCSRYGLHVDSSRDRAGHEAFFKIMDALDGTRSVTQIARAAGVRVEMVKAVVSELEKRGLLDYDAPAELPLDGIVLEAPVAGTVVQGSADPGIASLKSVPARLDLEAELAALDEALRRSGKRVGLLPLAQAP